MSTVPSARHILSVGYPGTGKTTFLCALYHVVISDDVQSSLTLTEIYEGDREHIVARYQEWLAFEKVRRTATDPLEPVVLTLRSRDDWTIRFSIPDLSGETFREQFKERRWTTGFMERALSTEAVMLFVNPMKVVDPSTIAEAQPAVRELSRESEVAEDRRVSVEMPGPEVTKAGPGDGSSASEHRGAAEGSVASGEAENETDDGFDVKDCCTQVKYVDLLQCLEEHISVRPLRVAIIVSALDTLDGVAHRNRPELFIQERLALLDQYLKASSDHLSYRVYGISAQGAEYDQDGKAKLQLLEKASDRVRVVSDGVTDSDITRPLRWLAVGEE